MPQGNPRSGERYLHFKNRLYQVVTIAKHSETGEKLVIYQALYDDFSVYARPFSMFISEVNHKKYPQVKQKYRFMLLEDAGVQKMDGVEVYTESEQPENKTNENTEDNQEKIEVRDLLMAFYDAKSYGEKYRILTEMRNDITDRMIDNMAVVLDVVISEGDLEKRYEELKRCLRTYEKYEVFR